MKDLIERLRDESIHVFDANEAADALEQQAAVIEQLRAALIWARDEGEGWRKTACKVLTLQPCPEVLNKVKADAHRAGMLAAAEKCAEYATTQGKYLAEHIREAAK
jgi:hypothetical protein